MKLLLITASVIALSACASELPIICNEDIVYDGKLDTPVETCRGETPTGEMSIPNDPREGNEHPDTTDEEEDDEDVTYSVPDDSDDPSDPDSVDKPDRVKGNNGWGNGDQSAPGNSQDNNNAENSGRSQRNH